MLENSVRKVVSWPDLLREYWLQIGFEDYATNKPFRELPDREQQCLYEMGRLLGAWFRASGVRETRITLVYPNVLYECLYQCQSVGLKGIK
jgi:hypothetical protein